jgi:hypothetical protein
MPYACITKNRLRCFECMDKAPKIERQKRFTMSCFDKKWRGIRHPPPNVIYERSLLAREIDIVHCIHRHDVCR